MGWPFNLFKIDGKGLKLWQFRFAGVNLGISGDRGWIRKNGRNETKTKVFAPKWVFLWRI